MIEFDYNRYPLIKALKKGGSRLIKEPSKANFMSVKHEVNALLRENPQLSRPTSAFVTFEYTLGVNLMRDLDAQEADIPTNIKWEKRNRRGLQRCMDLFKSWALISVLATLIFALIFYVRYRV